MSQELDWKSDNAPTGQRWSVAVGDAHAGTWFELRAYEDGNWVVIGQCASANGYGELNLANAKRRAQTVWEAMR